jgi:aldehyde dehydrogenase (NAD+)
MITEALHDTQTQVGAIKDRVDRIFAAQSANRLAVGSTDAKTRIGKLKQMLRWIEGNRQKIYDALYADFKKPQSETDLTEIYYATTEIKHALRHLRDWMRPKPVNPTLAYMTTRAELRYEPKGTVLIIAPWNFPFNLTIGPLVSAIAAGNCVCVKPSEYTPHTSALIREMLGELFDENEVAVFEGAVEVSQALLAKPFHHIFFTGSPAVGKVVMRAAAEHLSTVTLELGGKSPAIIDESANIGDAAAKIVWGKWTNNGQTCIAPDYLMVHEKKYDAFMSALKKNIEKSYGATEEERRGSADYGRVASERHHGRLKQMLDDSVNMGANVFVGGKLDASDRYLAPTVLTEVPEQAPVMQEEIFGPLLPVIKIKNLDEALDRVNAGEKPLALYLFSGRNKNIERVLDRTSAGGTCVNDCLVHYLHPNLPFGGINNSGHGSSHGYFGFKAFSHERAVLRHNALAPMKMMYPPYTGFVKKIIALVTRFM